MAYLHVDPSIPWLLKLQARARTRRLLQGFSTPRRLLLSSLGLLLAFAYLAQAVFSMWLREPMAPGRLREIVPMALLAYVLWDVVQVAWKRPKQGVRFRPEEQQQLGMAPLARADLILYRLLAIATASTLKAAFFCVVMIADLPVWPLSFLGAVLALVLVDQLRLIVATSVEGMTARGFRWFRVAVLAIAATMGLSSAVIAYCSSDPLPGNSFAGSFILGLRIVEAFGVLGETWVGRIAQLPFLAYGHLIATDQLSWHWLTAGAIALLMNFGLAHGLLALDGHVQRVLRWRERRHFHTHGKPLPADGMSAMGGAELISLPGYGAWTAVAWRQLQSAGRYWPNLLLALVAPGALSLCPLLLRQSPDETFCAVVGSVAFYTFLLLPAALKFDFRRDVDRIVAIKMLPLPPVQIVFAQLLTPWLITIVFQAAVIALVQAITGVGVHYAITAITILLPLSLLCFALDNLIFLMYPHRLREEGFVMFVRTTLTFTAKGAFFALSLLLVAAWAFGARMLADVWRTSPVVVFLVGLVLLLVLLNGIVFRLSVSALRHFDINWDRP